MPSDNPLRVTKTQRPNVQLTIDEAVYEITTADGRVIATYDSLSKALAWMRGYEYGMDEWQHKPK